MIKRNFVFIGGKPIGIACLMALTERGLKPDLVIGNMDDDGLGIRTLWHESLIKTSKSLGLKTLFQKRLKSSEIYLKIKETQPEIIFCIGGTQIIPEKILKLPKLGVLNIHPAPLPKYRGRYSTVHAIFNGEKIHGVTLHWMNEEIDAGPIIFKETFPISQSDTAKDIYNKYTNIGVKLLNKFLDHWLKEITLPCEEQNNNEATYYPMALPNNGNIDWSWDGEKIYNFIRSMTFEPFPPPSFMIGNKKMVIVDEKYFTGFNS